MSLTSPHDSTVTPMTSLTLPASSTPQPHTGISHREHVQHAANLLWFATALGLTTSADAFAMHSPLPMEHVGLTLIMVILLLPSALRLASATAWQRGTIAVSYLVVWWHYVGLMEPTSALISVSALIAGCAFLAPVVTRHAAISKTSLLSVIGLTLLTLTGI